MEISILKLKNLKPVNDMMNSGTIRESEGGETRARQVMYYLQVEVVYRFLAF